MVKDTVNKRHNDSPEPRVHKYNNYGNDVELLFRCMYHCQCEVIYLMSATQFKCLRKYNTGLNITRVRPSTRSSLTRVK